MAYGASRRLPSNPASDVITTNDPPAVLQQRKRRAGPAGRSPRVATRTWSSRSSTVTSVIGAACRREAARGVVHDAVEPAGRCGRSRRGSRAPTPRRRRRTRPTVPHPPAAVTSAATAAPSAARRAAIHTCHPAAAQARAMPRPTPPDAPVTSTVRVSRGDGHRRPLVAGSDGAGDAGARRPRATGAPHRPPPRRSGRGTSPAAAAAPGNPSASVPSEVTTALTRTPRGPSWAASDRTRFSNPSATVTAGAVPDGVDGRRSVDDRHHRATVATTPGGGDQRREPEGGRPLDLLAATAEHRGRSPRRGGAGAGQVHTTTRSAGGSVVDLPAPASRARRPSPTTTSSARGGAGHDEGAVGGERSGQQIGSPPSRVPRKVSPVPSSAGTLAIETDAAEADKC